MLFECAFREIFRIIFLWINLIFLFMIFILMVWDMKKIKFYVDFIFIDMLRVFNLRILLIVLGTRMLWNSWRWERETRFTRLPRGDWASIGIDAMAIAGAEKSPRGGSLLYCRGVLCSGEERMDSTTDREPPPRDRLLDTCWWFFLADESANKTDR